MKKLILIVFIVFSTAAMQAQELDWQTDLTKASEMAIKSKKPLLLFFTGSDWCGWCMRLQKEVFYLPEFAKWAKENVILVELDFPRRKALSPELQKQNSELQQMFNVQGYPTVWFVVPTIKDGKVSLGQLGSTGYVAGGPQVWIDGANGILKNKK